VALLVVVNNLAICSPEFKDCATGFGEKGSKATAVVGSQKDLKSAMQSYASVKCLFVDTHGGPGRIDLADGTKLDGLDIGMIEAPYLLAMNARILFAGCNVGESTAGDNFMDDIGRYLLRGKGGFVGAATVKTFTLGCATMEYLDDPFANPTAGRFKTRRYDTSGALIGSRVVDRWGRVRPE
jgi:hypothetical protein